MISVVIATFNGEKHILQQLNSIENQTIKPDEVIISDDNSTDNTLNLINEFKLSSSLRIILLVNKKRLGYAKNFERALLSSKGDYIFLSDQDDFWLPNKISFMINLAKKYPLKSCFINNTQIVDENLKSSSYITKIDQIKNLGLSTKSFVMGACCLLKKDFLDFTLPFPNHVKAHDNWIVELSHDLDICFITEEVLQLYRRHDNNESLALFNSDKKLNFKHKYYHFKKIKHNRIKQCFNETSDLILKIDFLNSKLRDDKTLINLLLNLKNRLKFNNSRLNSLKKQQPINLLKEYMSGNYNKYMSGFKSFLIDII